MVPKTSNIFLAIYYFVKLVVNFLKSWKPQKYHFLVKPDTSLHFFTIVMMKIGYIGVAKFDTLFLNAYDKIDFSIFY